jgi:hypothetical protein
MNEKYGGGSLSGFNGEKKFLELTRVTVQTATKKRFWFQKDRKRHQQSDKFRLLPILSR